MWNCGEYLTGDEHYTAKIGDLECIVGSVISWVLGLAGVVLFIMLLLGGFKYLTSTGDPKALEGARKTLTSAIIGLVLVASAYLILVVINALTGADVLNFKVWIPN